jgi:glyoxylase-like metal-dependent hydrolase (beta-lactamase superfamily II)
MKLEIFDVEHGACALVTANFGGHVLIDCGSSTSWKPGTMLSGRGISEIDQLIVTNCDEDHVSGLPNLLEHVTVKTLLRNPSVSPELLRKLKFLGGMGPGVSALVRMIERYTVPAAAVFSPLEQALKFCDLGMQTRIT